MFYTTTGLKKALDNFLQGEQFIAVFFGVHDKFGKVLVVFTKSGRFIIFKVSLFGKIKLKFEYDLAKLRNFDVFVLQNLQFHLYRLYFEYEQTPVLIKVTVSAFGDLDKEIEQLQQVIYSLSESALPEYMRQFKFVYQFGTSLGNMKIFDKKILFFKPKKKRFDLVKSLDLKDLVAFDAYPLDYKFIVCLKFSNGVLTLFTEDFAPDKKRLNSPLGLLIKVFQKTDASAVIPGFLQNDEKYIYDCPVFITPTISNKILRTYFMLTNKGILILAKKKTACRQIVRRIGLEEIAFFEPFENKRYANIDKGFKLILKTGEKMKFHQLNIRQYDNVITEMNRLFFGKS